MTSPNPAREEAVAPCPFCGSEARHEERHNPMSRWKHSIDCRSSSCGMSGPVASSKAEAVRLWNDRAALSAAKPPASGVDAVARLAYGYELMHTALCHIAGTSGADRHWYVHKAQEITERITRVGEVTADSNPGKPGDCLRGYRQFVASLSPAATSGSEAGGDVVRDALKKARDIIVSTYNREADTASVDRKLDLKEAHAAVVRALAKPASSPAGGDVREAVARAIWKFERAPENGMTEAQQDFDWRRMRGHYEECADLVLAALSPSTSAAEPVAMGTGLSGYSEFTPITVRSSTAPAAVDGQRVKVRDWLAVARAAGHPAKQTPRIPTAPCSLRREGAMSDWAQIRSAPKDGRDIEILTFGGFEMTARWESRGFINEAGEDCGAWVASEEGKHPPCWSEGACWESNEDEMPSDPPIMWRAAP